MRSSKGTSDNAFQVALPDGEYTVWLVASDAEWDPPLFEVWANGEKKLDVRIPRARFVFMEPFQARATDGRLRIEFKGPHGWILNGLVIGKEGPELAEVVAKLERDIFFLTEPELPNWHEVKSEPTNPPLDWSAAEQEKGYVVFPVDYTEQIVPTFVPARAAIGKPVTAFATPGEFEPATFCVSLPQGPGTCDSGTVGLRGGKGQADHRTREREGRDRSVLAPTRQRLGRQGRIPHRAGDDRSACRPRLVMWPPARSSSGG